MGESYLYNIDNLNYENNVLDFRGWIFNNDKKITSIRLLFISGRQEYRVNISNVFIERQDVYDAFQNENSLNSGFFTKMKIENVSNGIIYLEVDGEYRIPIKEIESSLLEKIKSHSIKKVIKKIYCLIPLKEQNIIIKEIGINLKNDDFIKFKKENTVSEIKYPSKLYKYTIDIILPVYNGYEYLEKLFATIVKTKMNYRLIVINDESSDPRIAEILDYYANNNEKIILIQNNNNLGFVKTVNKAFALANNHIALVNTDVELPDMWLERLMYPIILNEKIASSTPFTNCGTICSFPNFCKDNEILENLGVQYVDEIFQSIKPLYTNMPTGVGFCMGINKNVLDEIGFLDADTFSKGYGEENDWCQRAIKAGYKNVHVENLFVYHKHGGSFLSEEKKILLERNGVLLDKKHPNYNVDVANYCSIDPVKNIRNYAIFKLLASKSESILVYFDHNIGGGATSYLEKRIKNDISNHEDIILIRYDIHRKLYLFNYKYKDYNVSYYFVKLDHIISILNQIKIKDIFINELATYQDMYETLEKICNFKIKKNINMTIFIHDFLAVCPTINLLNDKGCYCNLPDIKQCEQCLTKNQFNTYCDYESMDKWRNKWGDFLNKCDNVIVFSENSKILLQKSYGFIDNISVIPHSVDYIVPLNKQSKLTNTLNVGLIGALSYHKGSEIIKQMLNIIEKLNLDINIILVGSTEEIIEHKNFKKTGKYTTDMIPKLVSENDIDLFFISSIWPETFSYTTQEVIDMNLPIVSFNLGAQAEKVEKYSKGLVLNNFDAENILNKIIEFSKNFN
jgi:GT2 family glycosyltransferase